MICLWSIGGWWRILTSSVCGLLLCLCLIVFYQGFEFVGYGGLELEVFACAWVDEVQTVGVEGKAV